MWKNALKTMAELKTKPNNQSVEQFLNKIEDAQKRADCFRLKELMEKLTNSQARMWGDSIVGFGDYRYTYATGREGDWFLTGFSPRKQNLSIYLMGGMDLSHPFFAQQARIKTSKGCLYLKKLDDVAEDQLEKLLADNIDRLRQTSR